MQLAAFSYAYSTNIGDEIQTLSATQYLPRVDLLIERDRLQWYRDTPPMFVIFNGWFTHQLSWPPPDSISPLFVSFHASAPETLITKDFTSYFKRYEPIGCRSIATAEAFHKIGVDAYFSGCLTLTLKRRPVPRTDQIYAVDVENDLYSSVVPADVRERALHISHEWPSDDATLITKTAWNAAYLGLRGIYKSSRARQMLLGATDKLNELRHTSRTSRAEEILKIYSSAKLVITSRLHCALPCVAMGTPVILLRKGIESDPRFDGLRDFVRFHSDPSRAPRISWERPEPNPDRHLSFARALRERCQTAVSQVLETVNA